MSTKRAGWCLLWTFVFTQVMSYAATLLFPFLDMGWLLVLTELGLAVPALLFLTKMKVGIREQLHLKPIKPSTALMSFVFLLCCYPVAIAMNSLSMVFSDNKALEIAEEFENLPFPLMLLVIGVLGPVVEEVVFRGFIYGGLRTTGRIFSAMVFSGVLFGLMHGNLNQFSYTVLLGILWALLVEASGSLITSIICHICMNSGSVILEKVLTDFYESSEELSSALSDQMDSLTRTDYLLTGVMFLVISIGSVALGMLLLKAISLNEGRTGCFENIFRKKSRAEKYGSFFSIPMIVSLGLLCAVMVFNTVLEYLP